MKNPTAPLETTLENFHECEWKKRALKAEAQVDAVRGLPDKWRSVPDVWVNGRPPKTPTHRDCARQLEQALQEKES